MVRAPVHGAAERALVRIPCVGGMRQWGGPRCGSAGERGGDTAAIYKIEEDTNDR